MSRLLVLPFLLLFSLIAQVETPPACDLSDDPLPNGAVTHLGTTRLRCGDRVRGLTYSADGKRLASLECCDGKEVALRVWDAATGKRLATVRLPRTSYLLNPHNKVFALSADGRTLHLVCQGELRVWDVGTGELRRCVVLAKPRGRIYNLNACFSPDGKVVAVAWAEHADVGGRALLEYGGFSCDPAYLGTISLFDASTGKPLPDWDPAVRGHTATFSPAGKRLAVRQLSDDVRIFDLETVKEIANLPDSGAVFPADAFSPDGRLFAASKPGADTCLWDIETGRRRVLSGNQSGDTRAIVFTPDGKILAVT